jgi:hypothetical protein
MPFIYLAYRTCHVIENKKKLEVDMILHKQNRQDDSERKLGEKDSLEQRNAYIVGWQLKQPGPEVT